MLNAYEAVVKNGQITWRGTSPELANEALEVVVLPKSALSAPKQPTDELYDLNKEGEKRWGFMQGQLNVPDDIDCYNDEILDLFGID